ncbi:TM2 domain-containing protein [Streptococcus sp. V728]|uniref:TM2 domain-containing protein n=1 Tax=Streptococcus sp. V728 TaxID=3455700 RepID=UPI003F8EA6BC
MSNFTDSFLSANTGSFPSEQLPSLRQRLSQLDDSQANQVIAAANIKNPTTALILSIFLGTLGVDRFYIGHIGLGVAKLLLAWLTFGIWTVIDWFLIINATKKANLTAINNALATMTVPSATTEANEG